MSRKTVLHRLLRSVLAGALAFTCVAAAGAQPNSSVPGSIAFSRTDGRIWVSDVNGQHERVLFEVSGRTLKTPRWSHDGTMLVAQVYDDNAFSPSAFAIWSSGQVATVDSPPWCGSAVFTEPPSSLVLSCNPSGYQMIDGRDLFNDPPGAEELSTDPRYSAITTLSLDDETWQPLVPWDWQARDAFSTHELLTPWAQTSVRDLTVSHSDGAILVDVQSVGPVGFLALTGADGSNFHTLLQPGNGLDRFLYKKGAFSVDGMDLVAFRCTEGCGVFQGPPARSELVTMHRDGTSIKVLARLPDDVSPTRISLAPDGSAVTYSTYAQSGSSIYIVDTTTGRVRILTQGDDPDWGALPIDAL